MSSTSALARRLRTLHARLQPRPKREMWMPTGVHLYLDDKGDYYFLPGAKEIWERSERVGVNPEVYINLLPDMDGCCTCDSSDERCPCVQKLWDAIDLTSLEKCEMEVA